MMSAGSPGQPARQLTLALARDPSFAADDFLASPSNEAAYAMIECWPDWPDRLLLLLGPEGCGKSHLGAIWTARAGARVVKPGEPLRPQDLGHAPSVLLEDADLARYDEDAFFHLINRVREASGWLLISARTGPDYWGLKVHDLLSRLRLAPVAAIGRPDPALIKAVIVKLFADRQIRIEDEVVAYTALHCEQSLNAIGRFVAAVDDEALASSRKITRTLAARTLSILRGDDGLSDEESDQGPT